MNFWDSVQKEIQRQLLKQEWVAHQAGMDYGAFRAAMSKKLEPKILRANKIAQALGVSVEELLTGEPSARIGADDFRLLQKAKAYRQFLNDLDALDPDVRAQFVALVRVAAEAARAADRRTGDDDAPPFRLTPDEAGSILMSMYLQQAKLWNRAFR